MEMKLNLRLLLPFFFLLWFRVGSMKATEDFVDEILIQNTCEEAGGSMEPFIFLSIQNITL